MRRVQGRSTNDSRPEIGGIRHAIRLRVRRGDVFDGRSRVSKSIDRHRSPRAYSNVCRRIPVRADFLQSMAGPEVRCTLLCGASTYSQSLMFEVGDVSDCVPRPTRFALVERTSPNCFFFKRV